MIKILFVCYGNICRSTMAESVMTHLVKTHHCSDQFLIASAATSREEIGNPPHHGTVNKLKQLGIPLVPHRAIQMKKEDLEKYDFLIGMDDENIRHMERICGKRSDKIRKLLEFTSSGASVADPWFTGDFDKTYEDVSAGCQALLEYLKKKDQI